MPRFFVTYQIHGTATEVIDAESLEAANDMIEAKVEDDTFEPDVECIESLDFHLSKLHPVIRDGKHIHTTYPRDTDVHVPA